ncbi:hypothetical protein [uncultured Lactobacillus sp.]|uniref:hypothetical protein n=1 Tax=uncultured Lactobacillus sp. TaxID=153152 RepID=UPI00261C0695|nr:hypothetical protein [uncultured Lactobacillus sp.]
MKVASDVLGDLKVAYVDKTIINKLDNHKPLEDMDALNLIGGGIFSRLSGEKKALSIG